MGIENINAVLHQEIGGAFYVSDKYGGLVGWYDTNIDLLYIDERYKYANKLIKKCIEEEVCITSCLIQEPEVLKYFAERRIRIKNWYIDKKERDRLHDERLELMPYIRKGKNVKNAESKIKKRHG